MQSKLNLALRRFAKVVGAAIVAGVIAWLSGPDVADLLGTDRAKLLALVLIPVLSGIEKGWIKQTS